MPDDALTSSVARSSAAMILTLFMTKILQKTSQMHSLTLKKKAAF